MAFSGLSVKQVSGQSTLYLQVKETSDLWRTEAAGENRNVGMELLERKKKTWAPVTFA